MDSELLGLPWFVWGVICTMVGMTWVFVWPSARVTEETSAGKAFIFRWFHALAWFLLAISCFLRGVSAVDLSAASAVIGLAAPVVYGIFIYALIQR